jgi:hypothetical protein
MIQNNSKKFSVVKVIFLLQTTHALKHPQVINCTFT